MNGERDDSQAFRAVSELGSTEVSRRDFLKYLGVAGVTLGFAGSAGGVLAACGSDTSDSASPVSSAAGKPCRIAFFNSIQGNTYIQAVQEGAVAVAQANNSPIKALGTTFDANAQVSQMQDAVASGQYDAFVVTPVQGASLVQVTKQAIEAGILVSAAFNTIGYDVGSIVPGVDGMTTVVGQPMADNGVNIAKSMVMAAEQAVGKGSPCQVIYMPGSFQQASEQIRLDAIKGYLKGYPEIKIVAMQEGGYATDPALKVTTNLLLAHPDVNVISTSGDQMTMGVEQAVKNAGRTGQIKITGNAVSTQGVTAVREGRWVADPVYLPRTEGRLATELTIKAFRGEKAQDSVNTIPLSPIGPIATKETLSTPEGLKFKGEYTA